MSKTWPLVKLEEVLYQKKRPITVLSDCEYNLLGAHWYAKGLYIKDTKYGSQIKASSLYLIHEGDFVYNRLFAWKGSFAIATKENNGCFVSNEFPCFHINREQVEPQYLRWYFSRESSWNEALGLSYGATPTSRNRLNEKNLLSINIPLPPIAEQQRIVEKIERLAGKIEEAKRSREITSKQLIQLFEFSRSKSITEAFKFGKIDLISVVNLERGKFSYRPRNDPRFFGGEHPWIQISEIESSKKYIQNWTQTLNDDGLAISRKFRKGTLLISIAATIGAVGILDFDCCVPASIVAIIPRPSIDTEFLYHYLGFLRTHLEEIAPQSAQKNINLNILAQLPFPNIPTQKQRNIATQLDSLQIKIDHQKTIQAQTTTELNALLPSILDKAFKGKL